LEKFKNKKQEIKRRWSDEEKSKIGLMAAHLTSLFLATMIIIFSL